MNRTKKLLFTLLSLVFVVCMFSVTASAATYEYNKQKLEIQTEGDWQYFVFTDAAIGDEEKELGVRVGDAYTLKYTGTAASVNVPEKLGGASVAFVGYQTFKGNKAVQTVTIGTSVKYISAEAFMDCSGLQQVLINANVRTINKNAFRNCTALKTVTFHKNIKLTNINDSVFENCTSLNNFKIPSTVTTIGNYAFWNCDSMTEIKIPDSVTSLGAGAFYHCDSLIDVVIGNGIPSLSTSGAGYNDNWGTDNSYCEGTFEGCISLQSVTIGNSVTKIGQDCFAGTALQTVTIPENVIEVAAGAFKNCGKLNKVIIGDGVKTVGEAAFENCDSLTDITIGKGVSSLGTYVFWDCDALKSISIPSNVTDLGAGAFYHCGSLEKVVLGNGVKDLKTSGSAYNDNWGTDNSYCEGTFEGCVKLSEIVIGSGVKTIGQDCFAGTAFEKIIIPDNVVTVSAGAFKNCMALASVEIGNGVTSLGEAVFENCDALKDVKIGKGVVTVGTYAFWDCDGLVDIYLPSNITTLGAGAFFHCSNLETVVIGNGVTKLQTAGRAYSDNWGIDNSYCEGVFEGCVKLSDITLGSGLIFIGKDSFAGTQITTLTVPSKVSELESGAFAGAKQLKDVYFTGNWAAKTGDKLFDGVAEGYTVHYIKNKVGYDALAYNKAEFTPITVTFDNNNDDVFAVITEEQIMAPVGGYVIEPIIPAASGYRFVGWYKDSKCTNAWNFKTDKVTKNTTLYAKWDDVTKVKPVRPEELTSDAVTGKTIDLKWQAVDGATSYNVYVDGKKVNAKPVTENMYTVTGLKADTTYEIEVTAVNSKGESPKSLILAKRTSEVKFSLGDVDDDGKITAADARLALRMSVNLEKPTEDQKMAADIDGNGSVTAADARIILRISVNLEKIESYIK